MRALGARVLLHGADFDAAKLEAKRVATATGVSMVEDGREPRLAEGAGSIAVELLHGPERFEVALVSQKSALFSKISNLLVTVLGPARSDSNMRHLAHSVSFLGPKAAEQQSTPMSQNINSLVSVASYCGSGAVGYDHER
jgi:hypothetical protein